MVKAGFDEDYYAALELPSTASANEIKKQFHKLALQYHPDRNPDDDTTAKFQTIQAANEILTDPQQRAKYDAHRIRAGMSRTYTEAPPPPPRANAASRSPTSNFPPPPKAPPFTGKTRVPPAKGSSRFHMSDLKSGSWRSHDAEDAKAKVNDFKAWSNIRHGSGAVPRTRKDVPSSSGGTADDRGRSSGTGRDADGGPPRRPTSRRNEWEEMPDAGMASSAPRASTNRVPPKANGYAAPTPSAGDDPHLRSAYSNVFRSERPVPPPPQPASSAMPPPPPPGAAPPPPPRAPTARKPVPVSPFKTQQAEKADVSASTRRHMPYPTMHGEKTEIKSPGLRRSATSATPRGNRFRTEFYDSEPLKEKVHHARAASASSTQSHKDRKASAYASFSTTSSESSSDEGEYTLRSSRAPHLQPKTQPARPGLSGLGQRSFFNPYVKAEDARDEPMAPSNAFRRRSGVDIPSATHASNAHSEGFREHREKHQAEFFGQHQSTSAPTGSAYPAQNAQQPPLSRPRSYEGNPNKAFQTGNGLPPGNTPMYGPTSHTSSTTQSPLYEAGKPGEPSPVSRKWSDQWPFSPVRNSGIPKGKDAPPYWAIPSSLPASVNPHLGKVHIRTCSSSSASSFKISADADLSTNSSFRLGKGDIPRSFAAKPPLRSQSSDRIDVRFSPSTEPPRFQAGGEASPVRSAKGTADNPLDLPDDIQQDEPESASRFSPSDSTTESKIPPPPQGPACFFPNDWHHRFNAGTFNNASPSKSPSRHSSQKRPGNQRASTTVNGRRPAGSGQPGAPNLQPTVDESDLEPEMSASFNADNTEPSRISSEGSAMDIDPVLTPPSAEDLHSTRPAEPQFRDVNNRGSAFPARSGVPVQQEPDIGHLNMEELRTTQPLTAEGQGLGGTGDLKSSLPFASQPSPSRPIFDTSSAPTRSFKLPKPPKAPSAPVKLTPTTFDLYAREMTRYMSNWHNFNNVMLSHFHARQESLGAMSPAWISAQGDGEYNVYLESVAEDERVHKYWEVAYDNHREAVKRLGDVRHAMKVEVAKAAAS